MSSHLVQSTGPAPATASGRGQPNKYPTMSHGQHPVSQSHQGHRANPTPAQTGSQMRPALNTNYQSHYPRGISQAGDMKGGPVGATVPHGGIPAGPPPTGAPTGAPMQGFASVGQMVSQNVPPIPMGQPGQANPNSRAQVYGPYATYAAPRAQQAPYAAAPTGPGTRPVPMILSNTSNYPSRTFYAPQFQYFVPQQATQMLANQQGGTMMVPQPAYPPQQPQSRAVPPREKKIITIKDPDTLQEIQLGNRVKASSGPPQSAINPAPSLGEPAPPPPAVMMNPGGNMNVLPPQAQLVVNPIVPSQPSQGAPPQQTPPPQPVPQLQPPVASPAQIVPPVVQPPQLPLAQLTPQLLPAAQPVKQQQTATLLSPVPQVQQQTGVYAATAAAATTAATSSPPVAAVATNTPVPLVPAASPPTSATDTAPTPPLGPPVPGQVAPQPTQTASDHSAAKSDVAPTTPLPGSPTEASGSPADQAVEMESPEEVVNDSSDVSESAAAGDGEPGSRSSLQREEDEERRKVEVKNEENLRKSQEAKELLKNSQPQIKQSTAPDSDKDAAGVDSESTEVPEEAKVSTGTSRMKATDDVGSNDSGSVSGKEVVADENDEAMSRQEDGLVEEGEVVSDISDAELEADSTSEQWSHNMPDNNGKKKYDRDFLLKLQRHEMSMTPPKDMPKLEIFKNSAVNHTLLDKPKNTPTNYVEQYGMRNGRAGAPGGSMNRNAKGAQSRTVERPKKVIMLSSSKNQDVKLHTAENAWKPVKETVSDTDEALNKKFRGILNKLTPQRFDTLVGQVKKLEINSEKRLCNVAELVLEKALNETHFASTYAKLCHTLLTAFSVPKAQTEPGAMVNQTVNFRKMLLQKCQQEFEKDTDDSVASKEREKKLQEERQAKLDAAKNDQERKELQEQFAEHDVKAKRRTLGLMRFIGELYNLDILNFYIMSDCFRKLMKNPMDEDSVVCACKLFTTVGKKLADESSVKGADGAEKEKHQMFQNLMQNLKKIISNNREAQKNNQKCLPQRVIFMLEDVRELKERGWVPRRNEQAPKTLDQIQKDAEQEKLLASINTGSSSGGGGRYSSMQNDRNRRPFSSQSQSSTPRSDFKQTKQMMESVSKNFTGAMTLTPTMGRPQGSQWVTGASGGGSRNSSLKGTRMDDLPISSANKFDLLTRDGTDHPMRSQESSPSRQRERDAMVQSAHRLGLSSASASAGLGGPSGTRPGGGARGSAPTSRNASQGRGSSLSGGQPDAVGGKTHSLKGTEHNDERVRRYAETIIVEYTNHNNREELIRDFCDRAHMSNLHRFLNYFIEIAIDSKVVQAARAGEVIRMLHDERIVSHMHVEGVLKEQLSMAEDMVIDIPKYYERMAEAMAPLFVSDGMNFGALLRAVKSSLNPSNTAKMLVPLFKRISEISSEGVFKRWQASGISLPELVNGLPEQDVKDIEAALGLSGQEAASSSPGIGLTLEELCQRFQAALDTSSSAESLEQALRDVVHQAGDAQRKLAVRAFATVMLNTGLELKENLATRQKDYMLNLDEMDKKLHVDSGEKTVPKPIEDLFADEEASIHALYALQVVMQEKQHPKEATSNFINWLYDRDLVAEDVIRAWAVADKKHEKVGYHVTVQNASGFLSWLAAA